MKKINFCAMALAALTMFSCTQEESMNLPVAGEKANVTLNLKGEVIFAPKLNHKI